MMPEPRKQQWIDKPVNINDIQARFSLHINILYQYFNHSVSE